MKMIGKSVHVITLKRLLKRNGFSWKRMRKSLQKQRDEQFFRLFQQELSLLQQMAEKKEIDLYYFDGSGFNLNPNVPYCWSKKGQQAVLPAIRSKGLTVLGLLNIENNHFQGNIFDGAANSDCVIHTLDELANQITRKTIVVLDNASIHKSNKVMERMEQWRKKDLLLQFIPPYCPELNLIEILWKMMKHFWIKFEQIESLAQLRNAIISVLQLYGKDYTINFV